MNIKFKVNKLFHYFKNIIKTSKKSQSKQKNDEPMTTKPNVALKSISDLPAVALQKIFLNLTGDDLIHNVALVCKDWNNLIENEAFWTNKCIVDRKLTTKQAKLLHQMNVFNAKKYYFSNMMNKNLLKNPCGNQQFVGWYNPKPVNFADFKCLDSYTLRYLLNSYRFYSTYNSHLYMDSWTIEKRVFDIASKEGSLSSKKLRNFKTFMDNAEKIQIIDLRSDLDLFETILFSLSSSSNAGLKLKVTDFYSASEIGYVYKLKVYLINDNYEITESFSFIDSTMTYHELALSIKANWRKVEHIFNIDKPFRYILFYHAGMDTNYHYIYPNRCGIKTTKSSVKFIV